MTTLRKATPTDIPLLSSMSREIWMAHYPGIITVDQIEFMLEKMYAPDVIQEQMAIGIGWELIEIDGEPVGFLSYKILPEEATVLVAKLYVLPSKHGLGLGKAGLARAEEVAREHGFPSVYLFVNKKNVKAIRAYECFGFEVEAELIQNFGNGYLLDDYRMRYWLG
jgi:RimJ/RimL family protein N-acetyltransferase